MSSLNPNFPDIGEALYQADSLENARDNYEQMLRQENTPYTLQYAAMLEFSKNVLTPQNIKSLEYVFLSYKNHLRKWSKKNKISLVLTRRQKDFLGFNSKIRLYLMEKKNLSKIHDLLGFRIVLCTPFTIVNGKIENNIDSVKLCYAVLNETLVFFSNTGYLLIEAEPRSGKEMSPENFRENGIIVPDKDYIIPEYQDNVKDYISHPKEKGYQGLHLYVQTPNRLVFEIQIRDSFMDYMAEHGPASHKGHKKEKYKETQIDVDFSKIHIPGFTVLPNGVVYDTVGLQKSADPFNLLY